ncbi:MAG: DUF4124 domain-containing protein [Pseudomonadota bacterium]
MTAGAAEVWRWKDANGVIHYSDQPRPGAERVVIGEAPRPSGSGPLPEEPPEVAPRPPPERPFQYTRCEVVSPMADETFHGVQAINVTLDIEPALDPSHRVEVLMNGVRLDWPPQLISYTIPEVFRGSHTLQVRIYDQRGNPVCSGPSLTFHLRQQSLYSPARPRPNTGN